VPGHAGITGNEEADEEAKRVLEKSISNDEKYPSEDLSGWIKTEMAGSRQRTWEEGENVMKERKKNMGWQNDTEKLKRCDQVAVTRWRTGYRLPVLQRKTHTRTHPMRVQRKTKEVWAKGEERAKMLVDPNRNEERTNKKRLPGRPSCDTHDQIRKITLKTTTFNRKKIGICLREKTMIDYVICTVIPKVIIT
jgi:hypothetical protein